MDDKNQSYYLHGILPIGVASLSWGFSYVAWKVALESTSPIAMAIIVTAVQVVLIWGIYRFPLKELVQTFQVAPWHLIWLGFFSIALGRVLSLYAMDIIDLGVVTLLEKLSTIFIPIFASFILHEKFPKTKIPYAILALISSYFVALKNPGKIDLASNDILGATLMLGSALAYASTGIVGKMIVSRGISAPHVTFFRFALGVPWLFLIPLIIPNIDLTLNPNFIACLSIFVAAAFSVFGFLLFYRAYRLVNAGIAIFLELLTPLVGLSCGMMFFGEHLVWTQWTAIPILVFSVYKLTRQTP